MMKDLKVKKILIVLLSFILVMSIVLILKKHSGSNKTQPSASPSDSAAAETSSAQPLASAESILTPAIEKTNYAPIQVNNSTGFESGWTPNSVADAYFNGGDIGYEEKSLTVAGAGSSIQSLSLYRDGVPFVSGSSYSIYFTATGTASRSIQLDAVNQDTGDVLASQTYAISTTAASYQLDFKVSGATTWNGRVVFYIGNDGTQGSTDWNTVTFTGIRIIPSQWTHAAKVNQVGYQTMDEKRCAFSYDAGDVFDVVDTATNQVVYSGAIVNKKADDNTGETVCYGDFTNVTTPGTYIIHSQIGVSSYQFTIADDPYASLNDSLLKMLSLQRCGETMDASWAGNLAHAQCHTDAATIYGTDQTLDVTGGWHDAGDYGRYIKTGSKAVNDLLFAYMYSPNAYTDSITGPDSGNGTADILDEAKYELDWMLKMQASDGGVYNKVLTTNLAEIITPDQDKQPLYVLSEETTATADFAGTMATASMAFRSTNAEFADKCLKAAESAYAYLEANPDIIDVKNPSDIKGGEYLDSNDSDGRFYTSIALWAATQDSKYLDNAKTIYQNDNSAADGVSWSTNGGYGKYLYLMQSNAQSTDSDFYNAMKDSLTKEADTIVAIEAGNSYNSSLFDYSWGSNGNVSDNGIVLSMQYDVTGNQQYRQAAIEQVNYLLGKNSLDLCFVSGFGSQSPQNVHSRTAKALQVSLTGALVGGPNASREDTITAAMGTNVPNAKVYSDSFDSYSTNEIAIYWNSSLIHLLSKLK